MRIETNHQDFFMKTNKYINVDKKFKPKPLKSNNTNAKVESSMSGALALAFRMSQIIGIAPLKFERRRDGCRVSVSRVLIIWSYIFITAWIISGCTALYLDLKEPPEHSVRAFSTTRRYVWLFDFSTVMLISCLAVYRAPNRTRAILRCLDKVQKIKLSVPRSNRSEERIKYIALMLFAVFSVTVTVLDFFFILGLAKIFDTTGVQARTTYIYSGYYYGYITLFFLEMQFIFCALEFYGAIKSLNVLLEEVTQKIQQKSHVIIPTYTRINIVPIKTVNQTIDLMSVSDSEYPVVMNKNSSKTVQENIRHLALMYSSACDAVRQLNDCFAPELLALLMSFLLHLIVTPYNCIVNLSSNKINIQLLLMQMLWCVVHLACTVAMVEPAHITHNEMSRTNVLVSQLMLQSTDELVNVELNAFGRYLHLNNVVYSPMGVCVLSRSLVASIIASVTTYLVIIIQFQASETKTSRLK